MGQFNLQSPVDKLTLWFIRLSMFHQTMLHFDWPTIPVVPRTGLDCYFLCPISFEYIFHVARIFTKPFANHCCVSPNFSQISRHHLRCPVVVMTTFSQSWRRYSQHVTISVRPRPARQRPPITARPQNTAANHSSTPNCSNSAAWRSCQMHRPITVHSRTVWNPPFWQPIRAHYGARQIAPGTLIGCCRSTVAPPAGARWNY